MRERALRLFDHCLCLLHPFKKFIERWQVLGLFFLLESFFLLVLEVLLGELFLIPAFFSRENDFLGIAFGPDFVLHDLLHLLYVEVEQLRDALECLRLRTLQIEPFVEADLGQQAVDVLGLVAEVGSIPSAEDAVVVVQTLLALEVDCHAEDLEADRALQVAHAKVVLVGGVDVRHFVETVAAVELLHLLFLHAEATHRLFTGVAQVHFVANEHSRAATLVVDIWRLF